MSSGLFSVICDQCGVDLPVDVAGTAHCTTCARLYLHRFGYLIPLDTQPADPSAASTAPPPQV